jgi:hypothetical protein
MAPQESGKRSVVTGGDKAVQELAVRFIGSRARRGDGAKKLDDRAELSARHMPFSDGAAPFYLLLPESWHELQLF